MQIAKQECQGVGLIRPAVAECPASWVFAGDQDATLLYNSRGIACSLMLAYHRCVWWPSSLLGAFDMDRSGEFASSATACAHMETAVLAMVTDVGAHHGNRLGQDPL